MKALVDPSHRCRIEPLEGRRLLAWGPEMVMDLNPTPVLLEVSLREVAGTAALYVADQPSEYWTTDGTPAGTKQVERPLAEQPAESVMIAGVRYFAHSETETGRELWKDAGDGPSLVRDINPGPASSGPRMLTSAGDSLYFRAQHPEHGDELWRSDGTAEGTHLVKDIRPGSGGSEPYGLLAIDGAVYFVAEDGTHGFELWRSDGAEAGTRLVKDINPGSSSAHIADWQMAPLGQAVIFAGDSDSGRQVWASDGTADGTRLLLNNGSIGQQAFGSVNGRVLFHIHNRGELWSTDGTPEGTQLVAKMGDMVPQLRLGDQALLFLADGLLWKCDGTTASPFQPEIFGNGRQIERAVAVNEGLFILTEIPSGAHELWWTNGEPSETMGLRELPPTLGTATGVRSTWLASLDEAIYFTGPNDAPFATGQALWRVDADGRNPVTLVTTADEGFAFPLLQTVGERVVFAMNYLGHGWELWTTDGTEPGTHRLGGFSFYAGLGAGPGTTAMVFNGLLYFFGQDAGFTEGLWRTDGTEAGTTLVAAVPLFNGSNEPYVHSFRGTLYFSTLGQLYASDGTPEGTASVDNPTLAEAFARGAVEIEDVLTYSTTESNEFGDWHMLLVQTDGTPLGTWVRRQFPEDHWVYLLGAVEGSLFYGIEDQTDPGRGSSWLGVQSFRIIHGGLIQDFPRFADSFLPRPEGLMNLYGTAFFTAGDIAGNELWRSDGAAEGTVRVADIHPGAASALEGRTGQVTWEGHGFTSLGGALYFAANDGDHGYELWKLTPLPGDTNYDGRVDLTDFGRVKANLGRTGDNLPGELDYDGDVDLDDFGILKANFGVVGHAPLAAPRASLQPQAEQNAAVDQALAALGLAWRAADESDEEELP